MMRLLYVIFPAVPAGAFGLYLIHPFVGAVMFAVMVWLGVDATRSRPERGERSE
jgi:hypothetical protein